MRRTIFIGGLALLALTGCGGGGDADPDPTSSALRTVLTGTGDSATVTMKKWRTYSLRPNGSFNGTGADQTCPVSIPRKDGTGAVGCGAADYIEFRSDGVIRDSTETETPTDGTWTLSGSTYTTFFGTGEDRVVSVYTLSDDGVTSGPRRLRFQAISQTEAGSSSQDPEAPGNVFVVEEVL